MTTSSLRPAVNGNKESGSRSTAVGAPWSSAPSCGWWPTITGASDSAASRKTALASPSGPPPSTSGVWSTSDSNVREDGSSERPDPLRASSGRQRGTSLRALPTWVADFNPLRVGASVGHVLSFRAPTYAWNPVSSTVS